MDSTNIKQALQKKLSLWPLKEIVIPENYVANVKVICKEPYKGDVLVEASIRTIEGRKYCNIRTILTLKKI